MASAAAIRPVPNGSDLVKLNPVPNDPFRTLGWTAVGRGWESHHQEYSYFIPDSDVTGEIPAELIGTVFRNGPGVNEVYGTQLKHHIDGDGLICAITFLPVNDGTGKKKVHFRSRFVQSPHRVQEAYERKFLFRGQMGTQTTTWIRDSWNFLKDIALQRITPLNYRNPSNTNVFYWGGKLLSLYETNLPISLDPRTLTTLGPDDLGGALSTGTMSAHFRFDAKRDILVAISLRPGLRKGSVLSIIEFDRQWKILQKQQHRIPFLNYAHDFALFEHHYVFHITPFVKITEATVREVAMGLSSPGEQMKYHPDLPSRMIVIPRAMQECTQYRSFDVDPCHIFHFGTTRSMGKDGGSTSKMEDLPVKAVTALEFSAVCLPKGFAMFPQEHDAFLSNGETAPAKLSYFRLQFGKEKIPVHQIVLDDSACEFPSTHPYRHGLPSQFTWMMANARGQGLPFRDVVKVDEPAALKRAVDIEAQKKLQQVQLQGSQVQPSGKDELTASSTTNRPPSLTSTHRVYFSHGIVGEPIFIPRHATYRDSSGVNEDDGWIFVQVYHPEKHTTDFVILSAKDPQTGPLATIHLKHHVPYGFHGTHTPSVFFEDSVDGASIASSAPKELRSKL